jgi:ABC-type bacteriocin/lantibiotic exporter with double-glycine peptidase domain
MSKAKYAVAAWLEETARHALVFKSPGGSRYASERAGDLVRGYLSKRRKRFSIVLRQFVGSLGLQVTAFTALLGIGGWLVIQRQLTIGQLIAAEIIVTSVVDGFTKLGKHLETYYDLLAGVDKLGQLVDIPLERADGAPAHEGSGPAALRLRGVAYAIGERAIVQGVTVTFPAGSRVAIVGPEASGKTVLADLLYGLRTPSSGSLEVDGVDARALSLEALRRDVSMVKDVEVFEGSVAENVTCGRHDLGEEDARAALRAVGLAEGIEALPQGAATRLSSAGAPLSTVQTVRLMLARAIAGRPRLVVVDGLLDGLRGRALDEVVTALRAPGAPWTLVVLTCDPDIARRMDVVHVLQDGRLSPAKEVRS